MSVASETVERLIKGWRERAAPKRGGRDEGYGEGLDEAAYELQEAVDARRAPVPAAVRDLPALWRKDDREEVRECANELERALEEEAPAHSPSGGVSEPTARALVKTWRERLASWRDHTRPDYKSIEALRSAASELECEIKPAPAPPSEGLLRAAARELVRSWRRRAPVLGNPDHPDPGLCAAANELEEALGAPDQHCATTPKTLEEAQRFAQYWIETAAQHSRNENYWHERAEKAEAALQRARNREVEDASIRPALGAPVAYVVAIESPAGRLYSRGHGWELEFKAGLLYDTPNDGKVVPGATLLGVYVAPLTGEAQAVKR